MSYRDVIGGGDVIGATMDISVNTTQTIERWGIRFTGVVQGVGFRPLLSLLAHELELTGFVYNDGLGVYAQVQGGVEHLERFVERIDREKPRLCRITNRQIDLLPIQEEKSFSILPSPKGRDIETFISADTAPCDDCLREMGELGRRHDYAFTNCTNCGPRYSIIESMPYDRMRTTMSEFPMCESCSKEYREVTNRRYHAEPNACNDCGPHYTLVDNKGRSIPCDDVFKTTRQYIAEGAIVAVKGVGGYHLVCNALDDEAVLTLRERKGRKEKPFALMAGSLAVVQKVASLREEEIHSLTQPCRPIVLLEKLVDPSLKLSDVVAPNHHLLGLMLPYAPIHHVLVPQDALWVMTSGNRSGDSVIFDDYQALEELSDIADYFLIHNRRIVAPIDDSIVSVVVDKELLLRRSRGYVPEPLYSDFITERPILAMGSDLKNTFAINKGQNMIVGPHIGDLESASTHTTLEWTIDHINTLFHIQPEAIVVDKHPQFFSSTYGKTLSAHYHVPCIEVQHHHSHVGAVMAEYNLCHPVLGICLDGTGYGDDGTIWGGEFLLCHKGDYQRISHFHHAPLPGGEKAVLEPWRQALWYVRNYFGNDLPPVYERWLTTLPKEWPILDKALQSDFPMVMTSSVGRLFDAVACLLGLGNVHSYDAHLAIALETAAHQYDIDSTNKELYFDYTYDGAIVDFIPVLHQLMDAYSRGESPQLLAAAFHRTLRKALIEVGESLCRRYAVEDIAFGGGVFQNRFLLQDLYRYWEGRNLYINQQVPCNDGGVSLGQLWIGHQKLYDMIK